LHIEEKEIAVAATCAISFLTLNCLVEVINFTICNSPYLQQKKIFVYSQIRFLAYSQHVAILILSTVAAHVFSNLNPSLNHYEKGYQGFFADFCFH